jgi:hypothetical protein
MQKYIVVLTFDSGERIFSVPLMTTGDIEKAIDEGVGVYGAHGYEVRPYVPPQDGGCWFCLTVSEKESMLFDTEFDTGVHETCLRDALNEIPEHPEASLMAYLLEDR